MVGTNAMRQGLMVILGGILGLSLAGLACWNLSLTDSEQREQHSAATATSLNVTILTQTHGREVKKVIEQFEVAWHNPRVEAAPDLQKQLATERYIEYFGQLADGAGETETTLAVTTADVKTLQVLGYTPRQFKALACVQRTLDTFTSEGAVLESLPPHMLCGVFVFIHEDGTWKLAGFFNTHYPGVLRDWDYAPAWLRGIIGELPPSALLAPPSIE